MDNKNNDYNFETNACSFLVCLENKGYKGSTLEEFRCGIRKIRAYLKEKDLTCFHATESAAFIEDLLCGRDYHDVPRTCRYKIRCANALVEYQTTGSVTFRVPMKNRIILDGEFGDVVEEYLKYRESRHYADVTNATHFQHLLKFYCFLGDHNIKKLSELSPEAVISYVESLAFCSPCSVYNALVSLRGFLRYLYENGKTEINLSYAVPKSRYIKGPKPPEIYSKEEVGAITATIDRANAKGKRDYAMILLAVKLGLRSSDICRLKFEHLDWEKNLITLCQFKTGKPLSLPLLPEVGNAIIDYLRYGRPLSNEPYIFLILKTPYNYMSTYSFKKNVDFYMGQAGIDSAGRKKGVHILRHSLAGRMLENHMPLPIITEVLGHSSVESTMYYLRIDMEHLKQCALDVKTVPGYLQKGEWFDV